MITPPYLKAGDKVAITCPAKKLPGDLKDAIRLLESWGLEVVLGETVTASFNQYAGSDELRTRDLQRFLDDNSVKAVFAARGGYGTVRIIDSLDFSGFVRSPKWIIGFSDITVLHNHIQVNYHIETIHGQMPLSIPDATRYSLETLRKALFGVKLKYQYETSSLDIPGEAKGILTGGNLSLLIALSGSVSEIDYQGKILFIEDVGEYLYSLDRMMWNLKRAGKLSGLRGVVAGGFTGLKDNDIPFGKTAEEIIYEHIKDYGYPVCFNFPAGHISDNYSLIFGREVQLEVTGSEVKFAMDS